jgi:para-aminobenzoate synthetase component 1
MHTLLPWFWQSLPLKGRSGSDIFGVLFQQQPIAVLLESPVPSELSPYPNSRFSLCAGSPRQTNGQQRLWTPTIGQILATLSERLAEGRCHASFLQGPSHLPFLGGWLGWLGYDLAWEIETLPQNRTDPLPFPVAFWYEPDQFAILDHQTQELWLAASTPADLTRLIRQLTHPNGFPEKNDQRLQQSSPITINLSQAEFEQMVRQAKRHIEAGDIFQANLSLRFHAEGHLHPWQLYQTLHHINPSPFASYWQTPWGCIVSCSPERLVHYQQGVAATRPIAGTRPRGSTAAADQQYRQALLNNAKERAEHTMLVDLERNDLGRVCEWGSVRVNEFLAIESYSHVMHLVSNVIGTLHPTANTIDLIRAVFPGGTITGCPKVRCMEIIEALEPVRRSLFYGSCGYLDVRGHLDLNILIRTLLVTTINHQSVSWHTSQPVLTRIWGQVGAGIVADSDPTQEWLESLQKAQAQWAALQKMTEYSC